ncbi:polysaccharide biosynthesis/export family protein [Thioalkalivibrio sp.]|uniref:polysaccharide biosynthesis/export family protein n=1 Tax=Thioalkalivibrio sp. TaxID=2093813 RepID=UPI0025F2ED2E|nr:polysaccharide biosynthesis/export family protein [Thioalkalivibrio sp.]
MLTLQRAAARWAASGALLASAVLVLFGCAAPPNGSTQAVSADEFQEQIASEARVADLNEQLLSLAVESGLGGGLYRVGPEDQLRIDFFGVPELSREYRVDGRGNIMMPLVGQVSVAGLTLDEIEQGVAAKYSESYLRSPQVSAQVTEYRSQQFTIVGAVANPRVYSVSRQTTLIEALAMAGGVTQDAGDMAYLTDRTRNPETGQLQTRTLLVALDELMRDAGENNVVLGESALINVPRGGFVFVEGAVNRPGGVALRGDITVLKAIAEAGGLKFEADKSSVRVVRRNASTGEWNHLDIDYRVVRDDPSRDMRLRNGDVVAVDTDTLKAGWVGFWRNASAIAWLGWRPLQ